MIVDWLAFAHRTMMSMPDYMLSNNHVNELITHRFDFSNEVRIGLLLIISCQ